MTPTPQPEAPDRTSAQDCDYADRARDHQVGKRSRRAVQDIRYTNPEYRPQHWQHPDGCTAPDLRMARRLATMSSRLSLHDRSINLPVGH